MAYKDKGKERRNKKEYYQKNREKILQKKREYYLKNKEKINKRTQLYGKRWYQKNKERVQLLHKRYYQNNKERVRQYHREWYVKNQEKILQQSRKYYQKNRERIQQRHRNYNQENKEKILQYKGRWQKYKRKIDPKYRLDENMGSAIARSLKDKKAKRPWKALVDYTLEELMRHLEKQFDTKMNWGNYGSYWAVDHVKPKSLFNYTTPDDLAFQQCWDLKNLQPLEKMKNLKKKNRPID